MSVSREEYMKRVSVISTPEPHIPVGEDGSLPRNAVFWLHTQGMAQFERPEIEIRNVPAPFVIGACDILNGVAYYSLERRIHAGQTYLHEGVTPEIVWRLVGSRDAFWKGEGRNGCLQMTVERVRFSCGDPEHEEA